jgi:hypothetical protein
MAKGTNMNRHRNDLRLPPRAYMEHFPNRAGRNPKPQGKPEWNTELKPAKKGHRDNGHHAQPATTARIGATRGRTTIKANWRQIRHIIGRIRQRGNRAPGWQQRLAAGELGRWVDTNRPHTNLTVTITSLTAAQWGQLRRL